MSWNVDQERISSRQCVERKEVQRGRAVEKNKIVLILDRRNGFPQKNFPAVGLDELNFGPSEVSVGRYDVETKGRRLNDLAQRLIEYQSVIGCSADCRAIDPHTRSRVSLRIDIDKENRAVRFSESGSEINGRGSFTNTALLVSDGHNFSHR